MDRFESVRTFAKVVESGSFASAAGRLGRSTGTASEHARVRPMSGRGQLATNGVDRLTAFITVAEHLSFRTAAARLGVTPSALSHTMRQLEDHVGVRLLNRTTRSVSVTDAGRRLLERVQPALDQVSGALEDLNREREKPFGRLRIHASETAATAVIAPIWERFLSTYPDVHLEVSVDEASVDLVAMGFDAGIGPRDRAAADMTAVRVIGPMKVAVVGAPAYFARHGTPRTPDQLVSHTCVGRRFSDKSVFKWRFDKNGQSRQISVEGRVMVDNPNLVVRAALDGLGIAYTIEPLADVFLRSGQLVRVLEDWSPSFEGFFLFYPGRRQVPSALRALIDMIKATHGPAPSKARMTRDGIAEGAGP
jgi:DNA-binding transcriptional LysR family regulator